MCRQRRDLELRRLLLSDCDWPVARPPDWEKWLDQPQTDAEEALCF